MCTTLAWMLYKHADKNTDGHFECIMVRYVDPSITFLVTRLKHSTHLNNLNRV